MSFSIRTLLYAMLAMAPLAANAHLILQSPVPYGVQTKPPLAPDGSDFPCKGIPYTVNTMNTWPVGSTQKLKIIGTAVHGGGSCQVSVTTDKTPTKDSKWKVIYSIEGGCPMDTLGNLPDDANPDLSFDFSIPSELPNGEMSMAWTWFNRVGNREMYMACAPVTVSGGASDTKGYDALPDMAIANINVQGNTCKTAEGTGGYEFANPGKYVKKNTPATGALAPLCGQGTQGSGGNTQPQGPAAPAPAPPAAPAAPSPSTANKQTSTLRTIITVTAPSGPSPTPIAGSPAAPAPAPAPPSTSQASAAPAVPGNSTCSPGGSIVCSADGMQFALCNFGKAVFQPVAAGTKCVGGKIARRGEVLETMRTVYV
jgi:hypothetical protein